MKEFAEAEKAVAQRLANVTPKEDVAPAPDKKLLPIAKPAMVTGPTSSYQDFEPRSSVRGLRDAAIELGQVAGETGHPASEEDLTRVLDRHGVRDQKTRAALVKLRRQIEGGAS